MESLPETNSRLMMTHSSQSGLPKRLDPGTNFAPEDASSNELALDDDDVNLSLKVQQARVKALSYRNESLALSRKRYAEAFKKIRLMLREQKAEVHQLRRELHEERAQSARRAIAAASTSYMLKAENTLLKRQFARIRGRLGSRINELTRKIFLQTKPLPNFGPFSPEDVEKLQKSELVDELFYNTRYPDAAEMGLDAATHYLLIGAKEGRDPHPLFDTSYYLSQKPELIEAKKNPLLDYLAGGYETTDPNRFFRSSQYLQHCSQAKPNPIVHYLKEGARSGINPSSFFNTEHYLKAYPEVAASGLNPLVHYLLIGCYEGKSPHPLFDSAYYLDGMSASLLAPFPLNYHYDELLPRELLYMHSHFANQDRNSTHPFLHFLEHGAQNMKDPHPLFSSSFYCKKYPDVLSSNAAPFVHYVINGWKELRQPHPLFDSLYYVQHVPAVAKEESDPVAHYLIHGAESGANPSPHFDGRYYTSRYLESTGVNPLVHYILEGSKALASPSPDFDPLFYRNRYSDVREANLEPLTHYVRYGAIEKRARNQREYEELHPLNKKAIDAPPIDTAIEFPRVADPDVSVIIPVYGQIDYTLQCLRSLQRHESKYSFEVLVVDDDSQDNTCEALSDIPGLRLLQMPKNGGFIMSCNLGASKARGRYLVFLNNDTEVSDGWLDEMIRTFATTPSAGLVGSKLVYPNGRLQEAGGIIYREGGGAANFGRNDDATKPEYNYLRAVDYCSGASIGIPKDLFMEIGQFDTEYCPAYAEDVDLAFKVRRHGKEVFYQPLSRVIHYEGVSSGTDTSSGVKAYQVINLKKIYERWQNKIRLHPVKGTLPYHERARGVKARLLVIDSYTPKPDQDAGSALTFEWLKNFRDWGYHCTYYPAHAPKFEPKYTEDLQRIGVKVLYPPHVKSLEQFLETEGDTFDAILIFRVTVFHTQIEALRKYCPSAKIIFHTIDLHYLRNEREAQVKQDAYLFTKAEVFKKQELDAIKTSDCTVLVSPAEEEIILQDEIPDARLAVIPLSCAISRTAKSYSERKDIVFVGGFLHPPNVDAVRFLVTEIFPTIKQNLPECRLFIIGGNAPEELQQLADCDVIFTGKVADLSRYFDRCRVSVAPVRAGAGMKGKVLTSLAHSLPCVATPIAAEGIGLEDGKNVLIASDPVEFANRVIEAYSNEGLWNHISANGLSVVSNTYSQELIKDKMSKMLADLGLPSDSES